MIFSNAFLWTHFIVHELAGPAIPALHALSPRRVTGTVVVVIIVLILIVTLIRCAAAVLAEVRQG
jgi:hypothetical protein